MVSGSGDKMQRFLTKHAALFAEYQKDFQKRQEWRDQLDYPVIQLIGPSRCGKDTVAEQLSRILPHFYGNSASSCIYPLIAEDLQLPDKRYESRHAYREQLKAWFDDFRADDHGRLVRIALATGDFYIGTRSLVEFEYLRKSIPSVSVWIDASKRNQTEDPTLEITQDMCDMTLSNNGSPNDLTSKLVKIKKMFGISKRKG